MTNFEHIFYISSLGEGPILDLLESFKIKKAIKYNNSIIHEQPDLKIKILANRLVGLSLIFNFSKYGHVSNYSSL